MSWRERAARREALPQAADSPESSHRRRPSRRMPFAWWTRGQGWICDRGASDQGSATARLRHVRTGQLHVMLGVSTSFLSTLSSIAKVFDSANAGSKISPVSVFGLPLGRSQSLYVIPAKAGLFGRLERANAPKAIWNWIQGKPDPRPRISGRFRAAEIRNPTTVDPVPDPRVRGCRKTPFALSLSKGEWIGRRSAGALRQAQGERALGPFATASLAGMTVLLRQPRTPGVSSLRVCLQRDSRCRSNFAKRFVDVKVVVPGKRPAGRSIQAGRQSTRLGVDPNPSPGIESAV